MIKEMETKLDTLLQSTDFIEKLNACDDTEGIRTLLASNNVDMTTDEIAIAMKEGKEVLVKEGYITNDDELTEKGLELVPGGVKVWSFPLAFYNVPKIANQAASAALRLGLTVALSAFNK